MPVTIDEFSVKSLYLETYRDQQPIGVATGFVIKQGTATNIVTNWHVVTGRHPATNEPISAAGAADPNNMKVWF